MAYTLKTTGIATNLVFCLVVQEDGASVVELVSTSVDSTKTIADGNGYGSGATQVTLSTATWKGVSRGTFETKTNGFGFYGIKFVTNIPAVDFAGTNGCSFFAAAAGRGTPSGSTTSGIVANSADSFRWGRDATEKLAIEISSGVRHTATTAMPTNGTTKFSVGMRYKSNDTAEMFYGAESGSLASDSTAANPGGFGASYNADNVGGRVGSSGENIKFHIVCAFDKKLSLAEFQSLHDDWFGTLIDGGTVGKALEESSWDPSLSPPAGNVFVSMWRRMLSWLPVVGKLVAA